MKTPETKQDKKSIIQAADSVDQYKRQYLKWTPPVVVGVLLPTHAQATHGGECNASPIATGTPPTCKDLQFLEGNGTMTILSDGEPLDILSISHNAPGTDTITLPGVPATVTSSSGINVVWKGPALDAVNCLPVNNISITVSYNCNDDHDGPFSATLSLTAALGG
jgi:hypothetical protein